MKSVVRNWRDPACRRKVKVIRISEIEIVIMAGGSRYHYPGLLELIPEHGIFHLIINLLFRSRFIYIDIFSIYGLLL